jgi:hypothetical protein
MLEKARPQIPSIVGQSELKKFELDVIAASDAVVVKPPTKPLTLSLTTLPVHVPMPYCTSIVP